MIEFKERKEKVLVILLVLCLLVLGLQNYQLEEVKTHHWFAVKTVNEVTLIAQQCESVKEQCCR